MTQDRQTPFVPEVAVLGHPNEGKSTLVSTLAEDDRIRVSRIPGETTVSRVYTVKIDGKPIIRFVDTPGFQVPRQTLAWFRAWTGDPADLVPQFIKAVGSDPFYVDECELLSPVARGAGIIYVVDGSRPVRKDDLAEMEILRLTGRPRMAVINARNPGQDYTRQWKQEFGRSFNVIRVFNASTADFRERIRLMESLKAMDQEWEASLDQVIRAFLDQQDKRRRQACVHITHALEKSLCFSVSAPLAPGDDPEQRRTDLTRTFQQGILRIESKLFDRIRALFHHHLYEYPLPRYSVLHHDLFAKKTWELLGLTRFQLASAGAILGSTLGAAADVAAAGLTFGIFTAAGGVLGAGSALAGARQMARKKGLGIRLGGERLNVGPVKDLQFFFIFLDRAWIYYRHMVRRSHGCRDLPGTPADPGAGISSRMSRQERQVCVRFFSTFQKKRISGEKKVRLDAARLVESLLERAEKGEG
jgi:hypothetical protein